MSQEKDIFNSEELFNTEELENGNTEVDESEKQAEITEECEMETAEEVIEDTEEVGTEIEEINTEATEEINTEATEENTEEATTKRKAPDRITNLPIAKIKSIIKLDPEVNLVNTEAVFLITKSTELFIKSLAKESFGFAAQNKKKTIAKSHVDLALTMLPVEL